MEDLRLIISLIHEGGPWGITALMAFLWKLERDERKDTQGKLDTAQDKGNTLLEKTLNTQSDVKVAIEKFAIIVGGGRE